MDPLVFTAEFSEDKDGKPIATLFARQDDK